MARLITRRDVRHVAQLIDGLMAPTSESRWRLVMTISSEVLVMGAGPAGLAICSCLQQEGVPFRLVDRRGAPGGAYALMSPDISMASPRGYNSLPGLALPGGSEYMTTGDYFQYLVEYAKHLDVMPEPEVVLSVLRSPEGFQITFRDRAEPAPFRAVVVATGQFDHPNWPALPGLRPAERMTPLPSFFHTRTWKGTRDLQGKRILVIGGATSAFEVAEECARSGIAIAVSTRKFRIIPQRILGRDIHELATWIEKLPLWLAREHCETRPTVPGRDHGFKEFVRAGRIRILPEVLRFEGQSAVFTDDHQEDFDVVVAATGYRFETPFLPREVERVSGSPHPRSRAGESCSWPGLYIMGMPCSRSLASEFLRGMAEDAVPVARRIADTLRRC